MLTGCVDFILSSVQMRRQPENDKNEFLFQIHLSLTFYFVCMKLCFALCDHATSYAHVLI